MTAKTKTVLVIYHGSQSHTDNDHDNNSWNSNGSIARPLYLMLDLAKASS